MYTCNMLLLLKIFHIQLKARNKFAKTGELLVWKLLNKLQIIQDVCLALFHKLLFMMI